MRNLKLLAEPPIASYDRILDAKQAGPVLRALRKLRSRVLQRYEDYAHAAPRLETLKAVPFKPWESAALVHCYDSSTQPLADLKAAIRDIQDRDCRPFCPYCGINEPGTVEHYLPRCDFPEYAVCSYNLVPACGTCNSLKGTKWQEAQRRRLLHFYYDVLPDGMQWLVGTVQVKAGVPLLGFELRRPEGLDPALFSLIESHYQTLRLCHRYAERSNEVVSEAISSVEFHKTRPDWVRQSLRHQSECLARTRGRNYWKAAGLAAMADSLQFINLVCGSSPPPAQVA